MTLGKLEKLVLQYLWEHGEADAKTVHRYLESQRGGSLNTVQSALDRLYKKQLLTRSKKSHAFIYATSITKDEFIANLVTSIAGEFSEDLNDSLIAAFGSISKTFSAKELSELESLISKHQNNVAESDD